jgi:uncharacterized membrane protein YidH (DUF202 family)
MFHLPRPGTRQGGGLAGNLLLAETARTNRKRDKIAMASKAFVNQATTLALCEGFISMVWEQKYKDMPGNRKFDQLRLDLLEAIHNAWVVLVKTSGHQPFTQTDRAKVARKAKAMQREIYQDQHFALLQAIGLVVGLLCIQLDLCNRAKRAAFQVVVDKMTAFLQHLDPGGRWDDPTMEQETATMYRIMETVN